MKRQNQCAPQFSEVALACGLVFSLLPGTAAAQDGADKRPVTETGLPDMPMKTPVENAIAHDTLLRVVFGIGGNGWGTSRLTQANRLESARMKTQFQSPREHGNHAI